MSVINIKIVSDFQKVIDFLCCSQVFSTIKLTITIHVLYIVVLRNLINIITSYHTDISVITIGKRTMWRLIIL